MEKIRALNEIIRSCRHIVFLGGAGVSTESGIPDFRSKDGLYNRRDLRFEMYTPEYLLSHSCLIRTPEVFFEFYRQKMDVKGYAPNRAHAKLAEMEAKGKLDGVITQNIDGLHQMAGSRKVFEIHGTTLRNYCASCGFDPGARFIFDNEDPVPRCEKCGGIIRPDVTLYEEALPAETWAAARDVLRNAECLIIGGTSLAVYPAASLIYDFRGRYLVIINHDVTPQDGNADLVFRDHIGDVMEQILC